MAVTRVGAYEDGEVPNLRLGLGRLEATIDDLAALRDLLAAELDEGTIDFEFDGGIFDDPEDIRSLSDVELHSIRLIAPRVSINLGISDAVAIGERLLVLKVYRSWARARSTDETWPGTTKVRQIASSVMLMGAFALVLLGVVGLIGVLFSVLTGIEVWLSNSLMIFGLFAGAALFLVAPAVSKQIPENYAIIKPFTRDEVRREAISLKYPRLAYIVAAASLLVAAIAVVVSVLK